MSCQRFRKTLSDAARGPSSPELEAHLSGCGLCREALAAERALLARIDAELQTSLEIEPSPAFLPAVRRQVAGLQAQRDAAHRWWLLPALATLAGVLMVGHFVGEETRNPTTTAARPDRPLAARAENAPQRVEPAPSRTLEVSPSVTRPEPAVARSARVLAPTPDRLSEAVPPRAPVVVPPHPRVFVPAEDERAVRRLARRLRGRAARAAMLAPEAEGLVDFTPVPVEDRPALVSLDDRALRGDEPGLEEPPSFDRMLEKTGRET